MSSRAMAAIFALGGVLVVNNLWPELYLILPAAMGVFAGRWVGQCVDGAGRSVTAVVSMVAGMVGVLFGALLLWVARIALWDALIMSVATGLGYLGGWSASRRGAEWGGALAVAATVICLVIGEVAVRLVLPTLSMFSPDDRSIGIRFPPFDLDRGESARQTPFDIALDLSTCTRLYTDGTGYPDGTPERSVPSKETQSPVVLHVGDSMTQGVGCDVGDRFVDRLQLDMPEVRHVNLGLGGTAPDFYFLMARKWVRQMPVSLVVVHLFLGNDIEGLGQPQRCCEDGPLFRLTDEGLEERCPTPKWRPGFGESLAWFASVSPPPAIVRQFAPTSQAARYLIAATMAVRGRYFAAADRDDAVRLGDFLEGRERWNTPASERVERQWVMFEAIMRALRDEMTERRVPLVVAILPLRVALEKPVPEATQSYQARARILEILNRLDIDALDPWDEFASLVKREGSDGVFLPEEDMHLGARGHRFYAAWLLPRLQSRLDASSAGRSR